MADSSTLVDRVKIFSESSGSGPFVLGNALPAFRGVEALVDGLTYSYAVENGSDYEAGQCVYVQGANQLLRTPSISSNGGAPVAFPANVAIAFTALAVDLTSALEGTGTVRRVNASGGLTGLTFTGGPIEVEGTLELGGVLLPESGGTGGTTPAEARTALGLGNVDNTSDANKPISTATQVALDTKASLAALADTGGSGLVGFLQTAAGAVPRTAEQKMRDIVSLRDFGAVGDGSTDDTIAVQAAFDSGTGAIFAPEGEYVVSAVNATDIYLFGPGTIRKKPATKGIMLFLTGSNRIEGVTLDYDWSNADSSPPNFGNITVEQDQGSLDLVGVKFIRSYDAAVYNSGATLRIDSACSFTGGAPHNGLTSGDERPTYYVFCIADVSTVNQVIDIGGAYFEGSSLVSTNLHLNPTGIFITASALDGVRFKAININGATLLGCTTNAGNGNVTGAIDTYNGADNIVISNNTIRYFTYAGLKIQNTSNFAIIGNTIIDGAVPAGAHTPHANGIVTIEKARGSTVEQRFGSVSHNIIGGCAYIGISNNCDFVNITNNTINGVTTVAGLATGINNTASFVNIVGNLGTDVLGVMILTDGNNVKVVANSMASGTGAADTAMRFSGDDILIEGNSFVSGTIATSTGIRTNGPASNVRIDKNFVNRFPYGVDIRTGGGTVDKIVKGTNQFANISIGDYNLGGAVTNATQVSTATWV